MKIVRATKEGITRVEKVFKFFRSSGSNGAGLPVGGSDGQSLIKSGATNFIAIWRSLTSSDVGLGNVTDDAQLKRSAGDFQAFTPKISPVDGDSLIGEDSADGENKKRITLGGIKTLFQTAFSLIFAAISSRDDHGTISTGTVDFSFLFTNHHIQSAGNVTITLSGADIAHPEISGDMVITTIMTYTLPAGVDLVDYAQETFSDLAVGTHNFVIWLKEDGSGDYWANINKATP